jgi:nicotinate phosphoribosyltransferase
VDFAARRTHGADAALKAARASFIAGAAATSNVLAGRSYGIQVTGTMAHSYVMAFPSEIEAFRAFTRDFPENSILLIDTYDTEEGARRAAQVARELDRDGCKVIGVRIDSGDLAALARSVRTILDDAGLEDTKIVASGDLDELGILALMNEGTPIDSFGVGTRLGTSADAPWLGGVYKLVAEDGHPKIKLSAGKVTLPGVKQVYRSSRGGVYDHDVIGLADEELEGTPLLEQVMKDGHRVRDPESLGTVRDRCSAAIESLPDHLRSLNEQVEFDIRLSAGLDELVAKTSETTR